MGKWQFPTRNVTSGGWFQIQVTKPGYAAKDVSFFRGVPTQLSNFSNADPFGDATASVQFPQITIFDDPMGADLVTWFGLFSNIDIWWVPEYKNTDAGNYSPADVWINPLTGRKDTIAPELYYGKDRVVTPGVVPLPGRDTKKYNPNRIKLWEGYIVSMEFESQENSQGVTVQCQGALFQHDRYLMRPLYPPQPLPFETVFQTAMDPTLKPHLRTKPLVVNFPDNWSYKIPARGTNTIDYVIDGKAGDNWTGYATRQTGSWEKVLTGYVQNQLSLMIVNTGFGVSGEVGSVWTINHQRQTNSDTGRQPVLQLRYSNRPSDFSIYLGTPGITGNFSRDATQMSSVVYGQGTSLDGTPWTNQIISRDGSRTDYLPVAYRAGTYPANMPGVTYSTQPMISESYVQFGTGFTQEQASDTGETLLRRDTDPGFTGNITLAVDPSPTLSRWAIRAGMSVQVKGLYGSNTEGIKFHIASVEASPSSGTVSLTVDTRYRDLLTVNEAMERTRDAMTPVRMLQANKFSVLVDDLNKPWSYAAGSGFIPTASTAMWNATPTTTLFPYASMFQAFPPKNAKYKNFYVQVNANALKPKSTVVDRAARWTCVPILTSEKGTIRRIEIFCLDANGNFIRNGFHVSFWSLKVTAAGMPRDAGGPSPYVNNAFTTVNPATGLPWPQSSYLIPQPGLIAAYGSRLNNQLNRAGFYPGSESTGSPASGIFVTEEPISYDNTASTDKGWNPNATVNGAQTALSVTIYAMFYAEFTTPVYFHGRMYKQNQGT